MHTPVQLFAVASLLALHLPSVCGRGLNPTPTQFARLGTLPASSTTPADQQQAAKALVLRVMGAALAPAFSISVVSEDPLENENDAKGWNEYSTGPSNTIALRGTSGVEVASALNGYLNNELNVTIDWNTYGQGQLARWSAATLPRPAMPQKKNRAVPWTYYANVCTYGYSIDFIPWQAEAGDMRSQDWVRHIDWMALNGVNLPLSFVGQEWVWSQVFNDYNLTFAEQQAFFSGPAFLPWFRMGNIRGWGGPITLDWLEKRRDLQIQILTRMRGLGMRPVLSAFAGHVPAALVSKFPNSKFSRSPDWANFDGGLPVTAPYADVYLVDPTDPLFGTLGAAFIKKQVEVFGTDSIYNADTYNEMAPPTHDPVYLKKASAAVYSAMAQGDPNAVWLMQGWLFISSWWDQTTIEAYLSGVPPASMWLLDLFGDSSPVWSRTASFYGHPYIWCTLLNFGGQQGIAGDLVGITQGVAKAKANSTISGVGITMEGIWTSYPAFEITFQEAYEEWAAPNLTTWWSNFGARRYGSVDVAAVAAWTQLGATIFSANPAGHFGSDISSFPQMPPGPPPPPPPAPPGFHAYSDHGYFGNFVPADPLVRSVDDCAKLCLNKSQNGQPCEGFEVYIMQQSPPTGNCYLFFTLKTPFTPLAPCATYIRNGYNPQPTEKYNGLPLPPLDATDSPTLTIFEEVWQQLMTAAPNLGSIPSYRFDLVDVGREVLAAKFSVEKQTFINAYQNKSTTALSASTARLMDILNDYDLLLSSDTNFMLGRWTSWAEDWGADPAAKSLLKFNAINILTLWGPTGQINDYAKKEWSGLVRDYYAQRWSRFTATAAASLKNGTNWDQGAFSNDVFVNIELPFQNTTKTYPVTPTVDTVEVSRTLIKKYLGPGHN